mmetsp:Transcript_2300/g.6576  ORF Transcript_2300/g.6576 Transcript_2300/m.6576 type:complete len:288 (-) Transcript_2300:2236-3099(-)
MADRLERVAAACIVLAFSVVLGVGHHRRAQHSLGGSNRSGEQESQGSHATICVEALLHRCRLVGRGHSCHSERRCRCRYVLVSVRAPFASATNHPSVPAKQPSGDDRRVDVPHGDRSVAPHIQHRTDDPLHLYLGPCRVMRMVLLRPGASEAWGRELVRPIPRRMHVGDLLAQCALCVGSSHGGSCQSACRADHRCGAPLQRRDDRDVRAGGGHHRLEDHECDRRLAPRPPRGRGHEAQIDPGVAGFRRGCGLVDAHLKVRHARLRPEGIAQRGGLGHAIVVAGAGV